MAEQRNIPIAEDLSNDLDRRSLAAAFAYKLVGKFPSIEQAVIAPSLMREAGLAFLALIERTSRAEAERDEYQAKSYRNMCRDQHMQIGFEGEDFEPCPVCQLQGEVAQLKLFLMDCPQCAKKESDNAALRARCERYEKPVSDVQRYFYSILAAEGLADWKIKIAADPYCWIEMKTIQIPDEASMGLFLHEVAHALYPEPEGEKKNHYHGGKWASIYGTLIDKYMRFNDSLDR